MDKELNLEVELEEPFGVLVEGSEGDVSSDAVNEDKVATRLPEEEEVVGLLDCDVEALVEVKVPVTEDGALPSACCAA